MDYAAHGHYTLSDPELQKIWLNKSLDERDKAFTQAFEKEKADRLFKGLDELHRMYAATGNQGRKSGTEIRDSLTRPIRDRDHIRLFFTITKPPRGCSANPYFLPGGADSSRSRDRAGLASA